MLTYSRGQIIRPGIDTKWGENVLVLDCQFVNNRKLKNLKLVSKGQIRGDEKIEWEEGRNCLIEGKIDRVGLTKKMNYN